MFTINTIRTLRVIAGTLTGLVLVVAPCTADVVGSDEQIIMKSRKLDGPRMGVSVLGTKPINVDGKTIGPVLSQFGWQFEWLIRPENGGPAFVTEIIPFVGGVEYSVVVPSLSLVTGIRFPQGFEFGMGPHLSVRFNSEADKTVNPSLVMAVGHTFDFSGVNIPLNLAMTNSSSGQSYSFVFGYAIPSLSRK